ncbi:unnamed protein product, partial [Phaeothamnion confervicola]
KPQRTYGGRTEEIITSSQRTPVAPANKAMFNAHPRRGRERVPTREQLARFGGDPFVDAGRGSNAHPATERLIHTELVATPLPDDFDDEDLD